jgi:microcystin-dependent protein
MVKYFLNPFATSGDKTAIPDAVQVSGSVSYASGWGLDYQKNLATDPTSKPVPRSQTNQLMYDITTNIQQYQQHGVPEFITTADNGGVAFPYSKYAIVRYDSSGVGTDYKLYQSLVDSNSTLPTNTTNWRWLDPDSEQVPAGTMIDFCGTTKPAGYLKCDGTEGTAGAVSRTTYAKLFAVIGTTWGPGDGSTTFDLPDFTRSVAMGAGGTASPIIGNTVGSYGGSEDPTLVQHSHTVHYRSDTGATHGVPAADAAGSTDVAVNTDNSGDASPTGKNIPPSGVTLKCIKY